MNTQTASRPRRRNKPNLGPHQRSRPERAEGFTASFKKLHDGMEAHRSPADGIWRVWALVDANRIDPDLVGKMWVTAGAGAKLGDAHRMAKDAIRAFNEKHAEETKG